MKSISVVKPNLLGVKSTLFLSVKELYRLLTYCENSNPIRTETKHSALLYMT